MKLDLFFISTEEDRRGDYCYTLESIGHGKMTYDIMNDTLTDCEAVECSKGSRKVVRNSGLLWKSVDSSVVLKVCSCLRTTFFKRVI